MHILRYSPFRRNRNLKYIKSKLSTDKVAKKILELENDINVLHTELSRSERRVEHALRQLDYKIHSTGFVR